MALKIRLRKQGRNNRPFYRLVLADARSPRDGKYVEVLGWYNPFESELDKGISFNKERISHWLSIGAEMSESAQNLIKKVEPSIVQALTEKIQMHKAHAASKRKTRNKATA